MVSDQTTSDHFKWHLPNQDKSRVYNVIEEMKKLSQCDEYILDGGLYFKEFVEID